MTEESKLEDAAGKLKLSEQQMQVVSMLVNQGARLERQAIIRGLEQYKGEAVSVDELIKALQKANEQ